MTVSELILFGVSFRTAPVAVRKTLTFDAAEAAALLDRATVELPGIEALVLSTCNRTEFYLAAGRDGRSGPDVVGSWHDLLKRFRPDAPATPDDCRFYERRGADAFRHLARLACGLDSAILGDTQLLSQLRAAVALARQHGTVGRELDRATSTALHVGRTARAQTQIAAGSAGIGSAVAATIFGDSHRPDRGDTPWWSPGNPDPKRVAVLGAGEAARSVARHLVKRGIVELTFCNRTADRADRLALEHGGTARPWADLGAVLEEVDAVAVATSAATPVLDAAALTGPAGRRRADGREPLLIVDAGFPPQVDTTPVPGVRLIPLEAIRQGEDAALAAREASVPAVEAMVEEAVADWQRWRSGLRLATTIRRLHEQADDVRRELVDGLEGLGLDAGDAERILRRPLRRLLHELVTELREQESSAA
jgi:glutamyl-tRNA reductase